MPAMNGRFPIIYPDVFPPQAKGLAAFVRPVSDQFLLELQSLFLQTDIGKDAIEDEAGALEQF